ncbi:MAG TPA: Mur ligase family protein [Actinomycetes bacterium]|nr:Mur ligase family protein [Actinomycetes bacterium]
MVKADPAGPDPPGHPGGVPQSPPRASLVELRVLDGANLYFPRPAIKLTLDVAGLLALPEELAAAAAQAAGLTAAAAGAPDGEQRRRFALRLLAHLVRRTAAVAGVRALAVRSRPGPEPTQVVLAYPWRRQHAAEALGRAVAEVAAAVGTPDLAGRVEAAGAALRQAEAGPAPSLPVPRIPTVAVTGTNGKTTVTRLIAHMGMRAGLHVGWSNTDGIYLDGELVEAGDWSGPGGAGRVLAQPGIQLAVLETARGGILRRGVGVAHNDVAVVTNISADHLGLGGIQTLDQLAEVKATIVRITRASGWVVLNADDPRALAMRRLSRARPFVFGLEPDAPGLRAAQSEGGRAATVLDGDLVVLTRGRVERLLPVLDVPVTLAGLASFNVANALAAAAAAIAAGLPREAVLDGLRSFRPDPAQNPGRMNVFDLDGRAVIVDMAHNEASLLALLEVARGLRLPGRRVLAMVGTAGDRSDELIRSLGELAARGADRVVIGEKHRYLRGRDPAELVGLLREGADAVGVTDLPDHPSELAGLQALVAESGPGDVCALMAPAERDQILAWLTARGARLLDPDELRARVVAARGG